MTEQNELPVLTEGVTPGIRLAPAESFAPQAYASVVPDAIDPSDPLIQAQQDALESGLGVVSIASTETGDIVVERVPPELLADFPRDANGAPVVDLELKTDGVVLSDEDEAEFQRLIQRLIAEPTSERAKQEFSSFKMLKGIN